MATAATGSLDRLAPPANLAVVTPPSVPLQGETGPAVGTPTELINGALFALLTVLMQLMQGQAPAGSASGSPGQIDQAAAPGGGNSGDSASGASAPAHHGSSSAASAAGATRDAMPGGSDLGSRIARRAEANAAAYNTPGKCLQETGKILREFGIPVNRHPAAWQALPDLQHSNKVREIHVGKDQLDKLPPGAIVVWDKGAGLPYGHISVALGHGREASSTVRNQLHLNTSFHVFVPVG